MKHEFNSQYKETSTSNYNRCLLLSAKYTDEQGSQACLLNEYWQKLLS
jgi:hypothetical protein